MLIVDAAEQTYNITQQHWPTQHDEKSHSTNTTSTQRIQLHQHNELKDERQSRLQSLIRKN